MKKLFLLIFPVLVCISVFFYFKDEVFNFRVFLDVISNWRFDNPYNVLLDIKSMFEEALTYIRVGDNYGDLTLQLRGIFELLKSLVLAPVYLFKALVLYLNDVVHNVGNVINFLFG